MSRNFGLHNPEAPPDMNNPWGEEPPSNSGWWSLILLYFAVAVVVGIMLIYAFAAQSRDFGQWDKIDPAVRQWFNTLMRPDNPSYSCCGEADAYWADVVEIVNGNVIAVITDDRDDTLLNRVHEPVGTKYVIPQSKIKYDKGNPTGHIILFLAGPVWANDVRIRDVLCYVPNGGV